MTDWLGLSGRVCVVTGAASGIGAGVARALAQAGARVALLDRDEANCQRLGDELSFAGSEVVAIACDTSREDEVAAAAEVVRTRLGPCTGLVNNAGMLRSHSLDAVSLDEWNAVMAVNLTGYLLCARTFSSDMRERGGGAMVHVASIAGHFPQTNSGAYSASKAGVRLLSKQMAVEWGALGIRSNTICPGMIRTGLSAAFYAQPGIEQRRSAMTASKRMGKPSDIADVTLFLLSNRSAYVNGTDILVDGGMSSMLMDLVPRPGFNNVELM